MKHKTTLINNRRYLGNKYKLLPFIKDIVDSECSKILSMADIFAGTGAVASAFLDKKIISNDIMYSNYICNRAWFSPEKFNPSKIKAIIIRYNNMVDSEENYMVNNFSDTFFSKENCLKIGAIRENIKNLYKADKINKKERSLLITSLLYAMDK
ncbi:MAG: hypothetical protein HAW65_03755, partial [Alphaproteobacteria bacterium]|nr:hypothetical protein [Alphaproteobacteria bacterium]